MLVLGSSLLGYVCEFGLGGKGTEEKGLWVLYCLRVLLFRRG